MMDALMDSRPTERSRDEGHRLAALRALQVLDTGPEPVFDAIVASAAQVCGTPVALISLIDADRQWFKARLGMETPRETPRDVAFCDHAIRGDGLFEVPDAIADERFRANPMVTGRLGVRLGLDRDQQLLVARVGRV